MARSSSSWSLPEPLVTPIAVSCASQLGMALLNCLFLTLGTITRHATVAIWLNLYTISFVLLLNIWFASLAVPDFEFHGHTRRYIIIMFFLWVSIAWTSFEAVAACFIKCHNTKPPNDTSDGPLHACYLSGNKNSGEEVGWPETLVVYIDLWVWVMMIALMTVPAYWGISCCRVMIRLPRHWVRPRDTELTAV